MKRKTPVITALALLLALAAVNLPYILPEAAAASDPGYYYESVNVDVTVQQNSDIAISEKQQFVFQSGDFHGGYRYIPMDRLVSIDNVQVGENSNQYPPNPDVKSWIKKRMVTGKVIGEEVTGFTTWTEDNQFWIAWWFPTTLTGSRTIDVRYTVHGGLRIYEDADQLYWKAIWAGRAARIKEANVTVHLPAKVELSKLSVRNYGTQAVSRMTDDSTVVFTALDIAPSAELEILVGFSHGIVEGEAPPWQAEVEKQEAEALLKQQQRDLYDRDTKPYINLFLLLLGILIIPVAAFVWIRRAFKRRGAAANLTGYGGNVYSPPDNLPPAIVELLTTGRPSSSGFVATLFDLGRQKSLRIEETKEKHWYGARKDYMLTTLKENPQYSFEKMALEKLSGPQGEKLSNRTGEMTLIVQEFGKMVEEESLALDLFAEKPSQSTKRLLLPGMIMSILSIIIGIASTIFIGEYAEFIFVPFLALTLAGATATGLSGRLARRTEKGERIAIDWKAFGKYLKKMSKDGQLAAERLDVWDSYFPYAVVFGIANPWIAQFSRLDAPAPTWFYIRLLYTSPSPRDGLLSRMPSSA